MDGTGGTALTNGRGWGGEGRVSTGFKNTRETKKRLEEKRRAGT